jgi:hypothetical protein
VIPASRNASAAASSIPWMAVMADMSILRRPVAGTPCATRRPAEGSDRARRTTSHLRTGCGGLGHEEVVGLS